MKVALLAPGPSLTEFADRDGYLRVAVNRAALLYEVRYLVMLDSNAAPMLFRGGGGPKRRPGLRPVIVTHADQRARMERLCPETAAYSFLAVPDIEFARYVGTRPIGWEGWSATTALALAGSLGATEVDCWGVDWDGTKDFDGFEDPLQYRTPERWQREQVVWESLVRLLDLRGVPVRRLGRAAEVAHGD